MSLTKCLWDDDDAPEFPARREVCPRCNGKGTHVNPAVDGNGISPDEFAEDPDFFESYMSGVYDVVCEECHGNNVVLVFDRERCTPEQLAEIDEWYRDMAESYAISRQERMMGA